VRSRIGESARVRVELFQTDQKRALLLRANKLAEAEKARMFVSL
jgi:hypothetical protein